MLDEAIRIGMLTLKNRLVMPPMMTGLGRNGHVTEELLDYYRDRARFSGPGLIITEHFCITEAGRASAGQLSIAEDELIPELRRLTDAIHEGGSLCFAQLNHAGSAAMPWEGEVPLSASDIGTMPKKGYRPPRPMTVDEIRTTEARFVEAAMRAFMAGYDGVEIHSAHGYLLDQFYSPLTNKRTDEFGAGCVEDRLRFLLETVERVRFAVGMMMPVAVRLGGADYYPGGATEEDAVEACRLLEQAGADLLDLSGGMCFYMRPGHSEPGYFSSMTEKIKRAVKTPVLLTGGVQTRAQAEELLRQEKADLIGVGRAIYKDARWGEKA